MKNNQLFTIRAVARVMAVILTAFFISGPSVAGHAGERKLTALQILDLADDHWDLKLKNSIVELDMLVYRENELRTTYKMKLKYQDNYHVLAETLYPPRNEGEKMLQSGRKNYWLFLPNINKAMKISESNSLSNSDFSNSDLLSPRLSHEYTAALAGTETLRDVETYKLELLAKDESSLYAKIVYWVRKGDFFPVRRDYYTFSGQLLKRLDLKCSSPELKGMLDTFVMSSVLEKDKKTVLCYTRHTPKVTYPDDTFSPSALMKR
ncbi:MAG: outer membrane lipoprotein-sorting protein [Nitrospinae bacterium]|nr:outer membrane lipoprotein-sorting protein [Nitrospinota bacterium]